MNLQQQIRALERIAETSEQHAELVDLKIALAKQEYNLGYLRGIRDGRDASNVYEQDFAYQHEDYTRGYWDGFRVGINETKVVEGRS